MVNFNVKIANLFWMMVVLSLLLFNCSEKDSLAPNETAPEIPPQSTLIMDFNSFDTSFALPKISPAGIQQQDAAWRWAAFKVGVWNLVVVANFAIPTVAFVESFRHEPVLQDDGSWLWAYNFGIGNSAKLTGKIVGTEVQWEMRITKSNQYTDFLWFTGTSNLLATEGEWHLNAAPNNPVPYVDVLWHRNLQDGTADIKYTNVIPNNPGNGGYISYAITNDAEYNAVYDIFNVEINNLTNIAWNRTDFHGHIKDPQHYSDSNWHCWDTKANGLVDVTCP